MLSLKRKKEKQDFSIIVFLPQLSWAFPNVIKFKKKKKTQTDRQTSYHLFLCNILLLDS